MKRIIFSVFLAAAFGSINAQSAYQPSEAIRQAQTEFQDKKFGIFLHWGLYSMLGQGEWVMQNRNINYQEYPKLAAAFYPSLFNADEWVEAIKASGAKYITITSRHHDGFSLWNSAASDYNSVKATPFKRDILKELSEACQRHGIALHFYYSHLDWGRPDYPLGRTGKGTRRPTNQQNWKQYQAFMNAQLTELLTGYGKIGAIWFDGVWDHDSDPTPFDWQLRPQYDLIHRLQPSCLVANNHHLPPFDGEDVQIFERDLPGENKAGYSGENGISKTLPLESCETMNRTWGYNITDSIYKTPRQLVHLLVGAAGRNANLLLNVGPEPSGKLPEEAVSRLR
ncbi:MAG: alpha-L-fucosidase, partial [Prevotella sp.]|nr:alpha-L-fucosidase [Prevotella sp.]